jgi:pyruvate/2-oxoglutarate dehydrogenase complex dihydrolipoamide dehydrogenase (E3) component
LKSCSTWGNPKTALFAPPHPTPKLTPEEYDLVIIGATAAARTAAIEAVNLQARVALILPAAANGQTDVQPDLYPYALAQIAKSGRASLSPRQSPASNPWQYANLADDRIEQQLSQSLLAARGVDVLVGIGEFCRRPKLAFNINDRYLHASAYLIATGAVAADPLIPGIQAVGYLTRDRLPSLAAGEIPLRWAIIGSEAIGVELAQTLARLGCQVKLIVETAQILPYENLELANLIQAQLEADGVQVYLSTVVSKVGQTDHDKLVMAGDESIAVDEILIALPDRPCLEPFNLVGVGVDYSDQGISIDRQLRTSHPQIYACGSVCGNVLGGYQSQSLTQFEAKIAVKNALSWRKTKIDYQSYNYLPWAVYTDPPMARVGMTIDTAQNHHRQQPIILHQYFKTYPQPIIDNLATGYCKIIVTRTGLILGAEIVGQAAPELIHILALAIQQKLTIADLTAFPYLSPTYAELIYHTAQEWHTDDRTRRQNQPLWRKLLPWWN